MKLHSVHHAIALACCLSTSAFAGKYSSGGGSRSYSSGGSHSTSSFSSSRPSYSAGSNSSKSTSSFSSGTKPKTSSTFDSAARNTRPSSSSPPSSFSSSNTRSYSQTPTPSSNTRSFTTTGMTASATSGRSSMFGRPSSMGHMFSNALTGYLTRPRVIYRDHYGSPFWYWLLDQPQQTRATWYYHHQNDIDPQRSAAMTAADPGLTEAVNRISANSTPINADYVPPTLKPEDMLAEAPQSSSPDAAAIAPVRSTYANRPFMDSNSGSAPRSSSLLFWLTFVSCSFFVIWLVFIKRWQVALP